MSPVNLLNQYSFVALSLLLLGIAALILWRAQGLPAWARVALVVGVVAALGMARLVLNYRENYDGTLAAAEATLTNGDPTLLMFYSNY